MGYINIDVDVDDFISDIESSDMIDELESRGYKVISELDEEIEATPSKPFTVNDDVYYNAYDLYRHLCDIVGCGYHEPKDGVLNRLRDML
jgi:hypothetical protein